MIMATDIESKPMWSETLYHEWHLGHIHRKRNGAYSNVEKTEQLQKTLELLSDIFQVLLVQKNGITEKALLVHLKQEKVSSGMMKQVSLLI